MADGFSDTPPPEHLFIYIKQKQKQEGLHQCQTPTFSIILKD